MKEDNMGNKKAANRIVAVNSVFPADLSAYAYKKTIKDINVNGMINASTLFSETQEIIVAANSEGYILIDLPDTLAKTKNVKIRLYAVGPPRIRKADLDKKIAPIVEADRLEISQVISEVSVDIVREIKKLPKVTGGKNES